MKSATKTPIKDAMAKRAKKLETLAQKALAEAKKAGCEGAVIGTKASVSKRLVVENKLFSLANTLEEESLGIVVHKSQCKGSASVNTLDEDSVSSAVKAAAALASFSIPDPHLWLPDATLAPPAKELSFLYDEALAALELSEMQEGMQELLGLLTRDKRVALDRLELEVHTSHHGHYSSEGVRQAELQTTISYQFLGMAVEGDQVSAMDYDSGFSFHKKDYLAPAESLVEAFIGRVLGGLHPVRCPSYKGAVVFSPRAVEEILIDAVLYHASGRSVMDGKSRWGKSLDTAVTSPLLTLRDDPHDERFMGATAFDSDGLPTTKRALIENGVLKLHLHDCYSAKRVGAKPLGTAGAPFALSVDPGESAMKELLSSHPTLLWVERFSGNTDPVTGDFSGVAKTSRLYQQGKDVGIVTETMIAGNFFELVKNVIGVSKERELVSGHFLSPAVMVGGVSVTGT